jgi:hypothetical protein
MKSSPRKWVLAPLAAFVLTSFAVATVVEAAGPRGGGGGGARAGGGAKPSAQANNSRADARTNDVRSSSVNNVNASKDVNVSRDVNVNVDVDQGCCGWDHPVAAAAAIGTTVAVTSAVVGSIVSTPPPGCVPVNYGGMVYQQCGGTWYAPQGSQYVVVNPPY